MMANVHRGLLGEVIGASLAAAPAINVRSEDIVHRTKCVWSSHGRRLRQVRGICCCSSSSSSSSSTGGGDGARGHLPRLHTPPESKSISGVVDGRQKKDEEDDGHNNLLAACVGAITLFAAASGSLLVPQTAGGTPRRKEGWTQQAAVTAPFASVSLSDTVTIVNRKEECQGRGNSSRQMLGNAEDALGPPPRAVESSSHSDMTAHREDGGRENSAEEVFGVSEDSIGDTELAANSIMGGFVDDPTSVGEATDERHAGEVTGRDISHAVAASISREETAVVADATSGQQQQEQQQEEEEEEVDQVDEEEERILREWQSKQIPLTVPLRVVGLRGSVPLVWLQEFGQCQSKRARYSLESRPDLHGIMKELQSAMKEKKLTAKSVMAADLITIGDSFLPLAIKEGLIDPIPSAEQSQWFQRLGSTWQDICCCSISTAGQDGPNKKQHEGSRQVWAAPYRWGYTAIAYRIDKFNPGNAESKEGKGFLGLLGRKRPARPGGHVPLDWSDLWRPELKGRIAMVNSPREVIGTVLKSLGASYNTVDFERNVEGGRSAVSERYALLREQVRLFDNQYYLKALAAGDVWVAVGWSSDLIPLAQRSSDWGVVVPLSGTSLWADLWAVPSAAKIKSDKVGGRIRGPSPLIGEWLDFCLQPQRALALKLELACASPLLLPQAPDRVPTAPENIDAPCPSQIDEKVLVNSEPIVGAEEPEVTSCYAEYPLVRQEDSAANSLANTVRRKAEAENQKDPVRSSSNGYVGNSADRGFAADVTEDGIYEVEEEQTPAAANEGLVQTASGNGDAERAVVLQEQKCLKDKQAKPPVTGTVLGRSSTVRFPTNLVDGMVPTDIALNSEFLRPLSEQQVEDFRWLLEQTSTEENKNVALRAIHSLRHIGQWISMQMPFVKNASG